jgi:hypothetical protein
MAPKPSSTTVKVLASTASKSPRSIRYRYLQTHLPLAKHWHQHLPPAKHQRLPSTAGKAHPPLAKHQHLLPAMHQHLPLAKHQHLPLAKHQRLPSTTRKAHLPLAKHQHLPPASTAGKAPASTIYHWKSRLLLAKSTSIYHLPLGKHIYRWKSTSIAGKAPASTPPPTA